MRNPTLKDSTICPGWPRDAFSSCHVNGIPSTPASLSPLIILPQLEHPSRNHVCYSRKLSFTHNLHVSFLASKQDTTVDSRQVPEKSTDVSKTICLVSGTVSSKSFSLLLSLITQSTTLSSVAWVHIGTR